MSAADVRERDRSETVRARGGDAAQIVDLGKRRGWATRDYGRAPVPERPLYIDGWWLVPAPEDRAPMPRRAQLRVRALYEAGLRPKGFVVAHEAPSALTGPSVQRRHRIDEAIEHARALLARLPVNALPKLRLALRVAAPLAARCLIVTARGCLWALTGLGVMVVVAIDPILFAVTEDDHWVEIDRWES